MVNFLTQSVHLLLEEMDWHPSPLSLSRSLSLSLSTSASLLSHSRPISVSPTQLIRPSPFSFPVKPSFIFSISFWEFSMKKFYFLRKAISSNFFANCVKGFFPNADVGDQQGCYTTQVLYLRRTKTTGANFMRKKLRAKFCPAENLPIFNKKFPQVFKFVKNLRLTLPHAVNSWWIFTESTKLR